MRDDTWLLCGYCTRPIHWVSKCISNFTQDFQNTGELISSLQTIHIPLQKSWICRHFILKVLRKIWYTLRNSVNRPCEGKSVKFLQLEWEASISNVYFKVAFGAKARMVIVISLRLNWLLRYQKLLCGEIGKMIEIVKTCWKKTLDLT